MNNYKSQSTINVYSLRIAENLVKSHGIKELIEIKQVPSRKDENKNINMYIFNNSPELHASFMECLNQNKEHN